MIQKGEHTQMKHLKKSLLPLLLAIAMLVMSVSVSAASSPAVVKIGKVTLSYSSTPYTSKAKKPSVKVYDADGNKLKNGTDYTVSYSNNKEPGTAKVKVKGKGQVTGSVTKKFTITKQELHNLPETVKLKKSKKTLQLKPILYLKDVKTNVKKKCYYSTSNKKVATVNSTGLVTFKKPGKATITATAVRGKKKGKVKVKVTK